MDRGPRPADNSPGTPQRLRGPSRRERAYKIICAHRDPSRRSDRGASASDADQTSRHPADTLDDFGSPRRVRADHGRVGRRRRRTHRLCRRIAAAARRRCSSGPTISTTTRVVRVTAEAAAGVAPVAIRTAGRAGGAARPPPTWPVSAGTRWFAATTASRRARLMPWAPDRGHRVRGVAEQQHPGRGPHPATPDQHGEPDRPLDLAAARQHVRGEEGRHGVHRVGQPVPWTAPATGPSARPRRRRSGCTPSDHVHSVSSIPNADRPLTNLGCATASSRRSTFWCTAPPPAGPVDVARATTGIGTGVRTAGVRHPGGVCKVCGYPRRVAVLSSSSTGPRSTGG